MMNYKNNKHQVKLKLSHIPLFSLAVKMPFAELTKMKSKQFPLCVLEADEMVVYRTV